MGGVTNLTLSILMQATDNVSSVVSAIGSTLTNLLPGPLGTITAAFLGLGTVAVSAAQDFQSTMLQVQALAGVSASQAQAATQAIMQMSVAVGQTPQQLAQGLYYIASAGYNASDSLKLLQVSAQAAAIGNTSTEVTANALTAAMSAFNIPASQASTVMDQFVATVSNGKTEFKDFAVVIGEVAVNAKQAGVTLTEAEAAFSVLTNVMPSSQMAKDSLDALLQTTSRYTLLTARAKALGVTFNAVGYESMSLQQRLQYLWQIAGDNKMSMTAQDAFAKLVGRQNAVAAATVLMTNNFSMYDTVLGKIRNSHGALDTAFQQTSQGLQLAGARLNAAWNVLLITLGTMLLPILTSIVNAVTPLVSGFAQWITHIGSLEDVLGPLGTDLLTLRNQLVLMFGPLLSSSLQAIGTLFQHVFGGIVLLIQNAVLPAIDSIVFGVGQLLMFLNQGDFANAFMTLSPVMDVVIATLLLLATVIAIHVLAAIVSFIAYLPVLISELYAWAAANALVAAEAIIEYGPLILIILAIIAVITAVILIVQHWGQIVQWLQGVWQAFLSWLQSTWITVVNAIAQAVDSVFGPGTWQSIITTLSALWQGFVAWLSALWKSIVSIATSIWNTVSTAVVSAVNTAVQWLQSAWLATIAWLVSAWNTLVPLAVGAWNAVVAAIQAAVTVMIAWLQTAWVTVAPVLTTVWNAIVSVAKTVWGTVSTTIQSIVTTAIAWLKAEWTAVGPTLTAVWNTIVSTAQAVWGQLTSVFQALGPALAGIVTAFQNLWNTVQPLAALVASQFVLAWQQLVQLWQSVLLPLLERLWSDLQQLWQLISTLLIATFQQWWQVMAQQLWPILQQLWQLISSSLVVAFQQWWAVIQPLLPVLGMIAGVIGGVLLVALVSLIGILAGLIVAFANVLAGVIKIFTGIVQVISGAVQIIGGIITLFIDLVTGNFGKLGTDLGVIWQGIVTMFTGVWNIISGLFQATIGAIIGFVSTFITTLVTFFTNLYNTLVGHSIIPDLMTAMLAAFTGFVQAATALWSAWNTATIQLFTTFWQTVSNLFNTALTALVAFLQQTWTSISSTISTVWNGIVSFLTSIGPKIISTIESPFQSAVSAVIALVQGMASTVGSIIGGIISKIGSITGAIHSIPSLPTGGSGGATIPGFASGIEHFTGGLAYVHQGEVLMNLSPGTSVIPSRNVHTGNGSGTTHYNTFNVSVNAPALSRREASTLAEAVSRELASKYRTQLGSIAAGGSNV